MRCSEEGGQASDAAMGHKTRPLVTPPGPPWLTDPIGFSVFWPVSYLLAPSLIDRHRSGREARTKLSAGGVGREDGQRVVLWLGSWTGHLCATDTWIPGGEYLDDAAVGRVRCRFDVLGRVRSCILRAGHRPAFFSGARGNAALRESS